MVPASARQKFVWVSIGLILGLVAGGLWPDSPAHAVATAQMESFAVCTAPIDEDGEAIFFLDYLTGDLTAAVLHPTNGKFTAVFKTNVVSTLGVDANKSPKFLLVSGGMNFRSRAGGNTWASSAIYVAELTSGKVAAYGIPWNRTFRNNISPVAAQLTLLDQYQFRVVEIR
jgi:hypothetical protein